MKIDLKNIILIFIILLLKLGIPFLKKSTNIVFQNTGSLKLGFA